MKVISSLLLFFMSLLISGLNSCLCQTQGLINVTKQHGTKSDSGLCVRRSGTVQSHLCSLNVQSPVAHTIYRVNDFYKLRAVERVVLTCPAQL